MKWASKEAMETKEEAFTGEHTVEVTDERLVFFDVEVYPNLFVICWKFHGSDEVARMINPKPHEVSELFKMKLVGFYNRRYDNHILYAAAMGATPRRAVQAELQDRGGTTARLPSLRPTTCPTRIFGISLR